MSKLPHLKKSHLIIIISAMVIIIAAVIALLIIKSPSTPAPPDTQDASASEPAEPSDSDDSEEPTSDPSEPPADPPANPTTPTPQPAATSGSAMTTYLADNCTFAHTSLVLINPVFKVSTNFIAARKAELVNLTDLYGIVEGNSWNGAPLMDATAASHLSEMLAAYQAAYPGHSMETRSCFRSVGTSCGRLCYATGTSDHHSGYTCDLLDPAYGTSLDTSTYDTHIDWQWLKANSYKYGFIDRFPAEWAGGPMSEPVNITADGSTGLYETWHYRYVGITAATEIATGKYNNGKYDSLEHYLLATGVVTDLLNAQCAD